jgi:hypothetical protein
MKRGANLTERGRGAHARRGADCGQHRQAAGAIARGPNGKRRDLARRAASPTDIRTPVLAVNGLTILRFISRAGNGVCGRRGASGLHGGFARARRMAVNIAKLPELLRRSSWGQNSAVTPPEFGRDAMFR